MQVANAVKFEVSKVVRVFDRSTVGVKVHDHAKFIKFLSASIAANPSAFKRGKANIVLPSESHDIVSSGFGERRNNERYYVLRNYRGAFGAYLRRRYALPVEVVSVIVYDVRTYLDDPNVYADETEHERIYSDGEISHVIMDVYAGPKVENIGLTYEQYVKGLAGEINPFIEGGSRDRLVTRDEAKAYIRFNQNYCSVAD